MLFVVDVDWISIRFSLDLEPFFFFAVSAFLCCLSFVCSRRAAAASPSLAECFRPDRLLTFVPLTKMIFTAEQTNVQTSSKNKKKRAAPAAPLAPPTAPPRGSRRALAWAARSASTPAPPRRGRSYSWHARAVAVLLLAGAGTRTRGTRREKKKRKKREKTRKKKRKRKKKSQSLPLRAAGGAPRSPLSARSRPPSWASGTAPGRRRCPTRSTR